MIMVCAVAMSMSCLYSREEIMSVKFKARIFIFFKVQNIYVNKVLRSWVSDQGILLKKKKRLNLEYTDVKTMQVMLLYLHGTLY